MPWYCAYSSGIFMVGRQIWDRHRRKNYESESIMAKFGHDLGHYLIISHVMRGTLRICQRHPTVIRGDGGLGRVAPALQNIIYQQ